MKTHTTTKTVKPVYVKDKHLTPLPKPTRYDLGPIIWTPDEVNAWDQLEDYFNTKADQGWQLVHVGPIKWGFVPCDPGEYIYRVVTLEEPYYYPASQDYLQFLVDSGVEIVFVGWYSSYAIVRRPAADGPFELTSTISSKLAHLRLFNNRLVGMLGFAYGLLLVYAVCGLIALWGVLPPDRVMGSLATIVTLLTAFMAIPALFLLHRNDKRFRALIAESAVHE